jgi:hypothetical protein
VGILPLKQAIPLGNFGCGPDPAVAGLVNFIPEAFDGLWVHVFTLEPFFSVGNFFIFVLPLRWGK